MSVLTDVQWIHCNICFIIVNLETTDITDTLLHECNLTLCRHLAHCPSPPLLLLVPLAPGPPAVDVLHRLVQHAAKQLGHLTTRDKEKSFKKCVYLDVNSIKNFSTGCCNARIIQNFPKEVLMQRVFNKWSIEGYLLKTKGFQILYATLNFWSDDGILQKSNISALFFNITAIL